MISVLMMCFFIGYALVHWKRRGIRYVCWGMGCRVVYACGVLLELNSSELSTKLIYRNLEQTALIMTVPFVILFVLDLYDKNKREHTLGRLSLLAVFATVALLCWTNPYHALIYGDVTLISGHLETTKTGVAVAFNMLSLLLLATTAHYLIKYVRDVRRDLLAPAVWMLSFSSVNIVAEAMKIVMTDWVSWLLPITVYIGIAGVVVSWFAYKYSLLTVTRGFIFESVQDGILIVNHKGIVMDNNERILSLLGEKDHVLGRRVSDILARWPSWLRACERMEEGQLELSVDARVVMVKVYPLYTRRQRIRGVGSILFDITDKQRHLEEVRQLNRLNDQLFAAISHDIRDPLALQINLIELLGRDMDSGHGKHSVVVDQLKGHVHTTYELVENLLEWFQIRKEDRTPRMEACLLSVMVEEVLALLQSKIEAKQLDVQVEVGAAMGVYADREAVKSVLRNLVSNAVKYSYRGGRVVVHAESLEDRVVVSVRDDGVGIKQEQLQQLFGPTPVGSSPGTAGERGAGLGLQVCREFVRLCGGRIWAESASQRGSVFSFSLIGFRSKGVSG